MPITVEQPPAGAPEAGVIEEARARQRRQRGIAGAALVIAAAIAALLFGLSGGGGGSHPGSVPAPPRRLPAKAAAVALSSCASADRAALRGKPSRSLLRILGVLRRPASAADAGSEISAAGLIQGIFARYIRRTRVIGASSYYIYPAVVGGCGTGQSPHEGMMDYAKNLDLGHGIIGNDGGGGSSAAQIERGEDAGTGPPGSSTQATITMIIPDGVTSVTLRYPAGRASGYSAKISPPVTINAPVLNNELIVRVPRSGGGGTVRQARMIWRRADGSVLKTFNAL
jgi:hypothetical protein